MRRWRQLFTAAVLAAFAGALIVDRRDIGEAAGEIGTLDASWVIALLLLVAVGVVVEGVYTSSVTPQLTLGRAVLMQQSVTAANNTVIGSGPVATGVRIAMMRSWGISDTSIGVSIVALNVVAAYRLWLIALATAVAGAAGADGGVLDSRLYTVVIAIAISVLAGSTVLWWVLLWRPRLAGAIARLTQRVWNRLRRSIRRLPPLDVHTVSDRARAEARGIVRTNGVRIILATIADQAITVLKPLVVVRAFGIGSDVISTWQVLIAFGLVRLAVALTPIPGGIGVTEFGLAALLVRFGGPESTVLAAVLVFRALTFVLPILTGGVCFTLWRSRSGDGRRLPTDSPDDVDVVLRDVGVERDQGHAVVTGLGDEQSIERIVVESGQVLDGAEMSRGDRELSEAGPRDEVIEPISCRAIELVELAEAPLDRHLPQ